MGPIEIVKVEKIKVDDLLADESRGKPQLTSEGDEQTKPFSIDEIQDQILKTKSDIASPIQNTKSKQYLSP